MHGTWKWTRLAASVLCLASAALVADAQRDEKEYRRSEQDPSLDNLVHPPGYETAPLGTLGRVKKVGTGPQAMVLVAGLEFGGEVFDEFMAAHQEQFTMYAVTLAGFAGTPAPPMPPAGTSYGELTWTKGAQRGVEKLIRDEQLERPILVGHWAVAGEVVLRLALEQPELPRAVVVLSGIPRWPTQSPKPPTLVERIEHTDKLMAPKWFKTVTQDTWDDNNFLPRDFATHPVRGLQLWRMETKTTLPTKIRYSLEARAQDVTLELAKLKVPTLVLIPGFDDEFFAGPHRSDYMRWFCQDSWAGVEGASEHLEIKTIPGSRAFIMDDKPEELDKALQDFLSRS